MAKEKNDLMEVTKIPIGEIVENGVYQSYVHDIVKVLKIDNKLNKLWLYNVSGAHKQWTDFKNVNFIKRFY